MIDIKCPYCGKKQTDIDLDSIESDSGSVRLTYVCECGREFVLVYNYSETLDDSYQAFGSVAK